jgi:hypothetical protein
MHELALLVELTQQQPDLTRGVGVLRRAQLGVLEPRRREPVAPNEAHQQHMLTQHVHARARHVGQCEAAVIAHLLLCPHAHLPEHSRKHRRHDVWARPPPRPPLVSGAACAWTRVARTILRGLALQ